MHLAIPILKAYAGHSICCMLHTLFHSAGMIIPAGVGYVCVLITCCVSNNLPTFKVLYQQGLCSPCALGPLIFHGRQDFVCTLYRPKQEIVYSETIEKALFLSNTIVEIGSSCGKPNVWSLSLQEGKCFLSTWHAVST